MATFSDTVRKSTVGIIFLIWPVFVLGAMIGLYNSYHDFMTNVYAVQELGKHLRLVDDVLTPYLVGALPNIVQIVLWFLAFNSIETNNKGQWENVNYFNLLLGTFAAFINTSLGVWYMSNGQDSWGIIATAFIYNLFVYSVGAEGFLMMCLMAAINTFDMFMDSLGLGFFGMFKGTITFVTRLQNKPVEKSISGGGQSTLFEQGGKGR